MLTSREVAERTGIAYRTLMRWQEAKLLNPRGARAGKGNKTQWRAKDLKEASVLEACRRGGLSLQAMRRAVRYLRSLKHNPLSSGQFIIIGRGNGQAELVKVVANADEAIALLNTPGQLMMRLAPWPGKEKEIKPEKEAKK